MYICKNQPEIIQEAPKLLLRSEFEQCYAEASKEVDSAFEIAVFDGLDE